MFYFSQFEIHHEFQDTGGRVTEKENGLRSTELNVKKKKKWMLMYIFIDSSNSLPSLLP